MRSASSRFVSTLATSRVATLRVDSWLGGRALTTDGIPVSGGTWSQDASSRVPERVTVEVPAIPQWLPRSATHPLSVYGQRLLISRGLVLPDTGLTEWVQLGWVRIQDYSIGDDTVSVECVGLAQILDDARFLAPVASSGTYVDTARNLAGSMLPVSISGLADRALPAKLWEDNRLDALYELADTWPATCRVNAAGSLAFTPAPNDATDTIVASYVDGQNGTLVTANPSATRDRVYNAVRCQGDQSGDVPPVVAIAYDNDQQSPTRWDGPYGQVPYFWQTPLVTTTDAAMAAAITRLRNVSASALAFTITAAIDPRVEAGDLVSVRSRFVTGVGRIDSVSFPLVPGDGGTMSLALHMVAGRYALAA